MASLSKFFSGVAAADTLAPLRYRNYFLLWSGQRAVALGIVIATRTLPQLFFGVFAGVVSDWFDHRKILLFTKVGVVTLSIAFAALLVFDVMELWHVYVFSFLRGSFMAFDQPA